MNKLTIKPTQLSGEIHVPPSKSISHRAIIAAALSHGTSEITNLMTSDDIEATLEGMKALGVKAIREKSSLIIHGININIGEPTTINCRESGSTLRFLIPIAATISNASITFSGAKRLGERPLAPYFEIFDSQNLSYDTASGKLPLHINGKLTPGEFYLAGNISSQFITGLLFALPLLNGDSVIHVTSPLESKGYIDLTLDVLKNFGIMIPNKNYSIFNIPGNQKYKSVNYRIESDYSQAAFWIIAGLIGNGLVVKGLDPHSLQGDKVILDIISEMGGSYSIEKDSVIVKPSRTRGTIIDASQCPDLVPILAVLGSVSEGTTKIVNASRLRIKESDRLSSTTTELNKLGADIVETEDGLIITGKEHLNGGITDSWNDHRIAMAIAVASIKCSKPVTITGCDSVKKSYPSFWDDFKTLGGVINELNMGK